MADEPGGVANDQAGPGLLRHCTNPIRRLHTKVLSQVQHLPPTSLCTGVASTLSAAWSLALPDEMESKVNLDPKVPRKRNPQEWRDRLNRSGPARGIFRTLRATLCYAPRHTWAVWHRALRLVMVVAFVLLVPGLRLCGRNTQMSEDFVASLALANSVFHLVRFPTSARSRRMIALLPARERRS